jgi:hypothetical protein
LPRKLLILNLTAAKRPPKKPFGVLRDFQGHQKKIFQGAGISRSTRKGFGIRLGIPERSEKAFPGQLVFPRHRKRLFEGCGSFKQSEQGFFSVPGILGGLKKGILPLPKARGRRARRWRGGGFCW